MIMGSPHYMSPEQMQSSRGVDERSDIWSLGAILHELLAGAPPFKGESVTALCATIMKDPPPPLTRLRSDVPQPVEAVVLRCLEKDPGRRFANVADLAAALAEYGTSGARASAVRIHRVLEGAIDTLGMPWAVPPEPTPTARDILDTAPPRRRAGRVLGYVAAATVLFAVGSGVGWMVVKHDQAVRAAETAADRVLTTAAEPPPIPPPPILAADAGGPTLTSATVSAAPPAIPAPSAASIPAQPPASSSASSSASTNAPPPPAPAHHARRPRASHAAPAPTPEATIDPYYANPYQAPAVVAPAPTPTPAPAPAGDEVFDDRK
jgi:serine/threonine-protein kinase